MGKRSSFERAPRDLYPTPYRAVLPLIPHLSPATLYAEPCAGNGALIRHLALHGFECMWASDIKPLRTYIRQQDALEFSYPGAPVIITNPPWDKKLLHPMIERFMEVAPTWLLLDADYKHTIQAIPYMRHCRKVVSVGRVKWIKRSKHSGKQNCAWYLFDKLYDGDPVFVPRIIVDGREAVTYP